MQLRSFLTRFCFLFVTILFPTYGASQGTEQSRLDISHFEKVLSFIAGTLETNYTLSDSLLIPDSEVVWADSVQLKKERDYSIDYLNGILTFKKPAKSGTKIRIQYKRFPFNLKREYSHRQIIRKKNKSEPENGSNHGNGVQTNLKPIAQNSYASQLRKSGSLTRGISVGSNQGLQVDSGLRMQVSGKLAQNIEVIASLTDQNTPIQPEGNTQTLQEIDKVFVQIKGPNFEATLGDYNLSFAGNEFTSYNRKLEGVMGQAVFENTTVTLSGAVSRGQFQTNEFLGQEGNQGPYQLRGPNGEIDILVLAGTEKVWVDGQQMTRGENNDYVIEYGNGQITFSRQRLITSDSRITVDFQFSDESFRRNLWAARVESGLLNDKMSVGATFIRESDDRNNPLNLVLNDDRIAALENSGDSLAAVPGWTFVGQDSGNYILDENNIFVFVGTKQGDHTVIFSFFGENRGDYREIGLGRYEYAGENQGRYKPFLILPQAQRQDMVGLNMALSPHSSLQVNGEFAFSQFDRNLYSDKGDKDNQGNAYTLKFNFRPETGLGRFTFLGKLRRKSSNFRDIDRTTIAEFNRRWNITGSATSSEENIAEFQSTYIPFAGFTLKGGLGRLSKSSTFKSNRWDVQTRFHKQNFPKLDYFIEFINRDDSIINQKSSWLRQRAHAEYDLKKIVPMFDYEGEIRKNSETDTSDSGFRFDSFTAGLTLNPWQSMTAAVKYNVRDDKERVMSVFHPKSVARTQTFSWSLRNWHSINARTSYTHRNRDFSDIAIQNTRTDLADFRIGYSPRNAGVRGNLYYQISNRQVARQEEVFIEVEEGEGNFRFNVVLNEFEPDPFGNFVRRIIATDNFIPVVELRLRGDVRFAPKRFFSQKKEKKDFWQKLLNPITTETFFRIDERTTEKDVTKIYFLNLDAFQQDSTTIFGSIELRQDVHLWENSRKFSVRYRFRNRNELNNQFIDGGQDRNLLEHGLRTLYQFSRQITSRFEFIHLEEDRLFKSVNRESRRVLSNQFQMDLVYRPRQRLEIGLKSQFSINKDRNPVPNTKANLISFSPRANYSVNQKGRLRAEIEWTTVDVSPKNRLIPFELTRGNRAGSTFRWNVGFDYRVSKNVQASMNYFGRSEPDRPKTQHIAKVEMRAFF